ncbi:hypothetical protein SteCoe_10281 [Stentor coeruleus]|uniref:P5A-ATPase transmembrane helical hairpin domain-containing protein n=1 Tax=Stentor coeruleus TaxID=5963 RepID=A0A1R2CFT0_9CILI|nr:hypothetical protein SteCoe_10281 [Stentor coeruleus]
MVLEVDFLRQHSVFTRLDNLPFLILHGIFIVHNWKSHYDWIYLLTSVLLMLIQAFLFLSTQWSSWVNAKIAYFPSTKENATHALVKPLQKKYSHRPFTIVPVR